MCSRLEWRSRQHQEQLVAASKWKVKKAAAYWRIPSKNTQEPDQECLKLIRTKLGKQTAGHNMGLNVGNKPMEALVT